jgi:hypothetical protein
MGGLTNPISGIHHVKPPWVLVTFPSPSLSTSLASYASHIIFVLLPRWWLFMMTWLGDKLQKWEHLATSIALIRVFIRRDVVGIMIIDKDLRVYAIQF